MSTSAPKTPETAPADAADPAVPSKGSVIKAKLRAVVSPPKNSFLGRMILGLGVVVFGMIIGAGVLVHRLNAPPQVEYEEEAHGEEHASAEGHEGGEKKEGEDVGSLFQVKRSIPKEILDRQDGVPEPDNDLADPKIEETRGLASLIKAGSKAEPPAGFVQLNEIFSGTKPSGGGDGNVVAIIFLEVDSLEARREAVKRSSEFQAVISSMISEHPRENLLAFEGVASLKTEIQRELNHKMKSGRIVDVLFSNFFVK